MNAGAWAATDRQRDEFWTNGFVRVPAALSAEACDRLVEAIDRRMAILDVPREGAPTEMAIWHVDQCFRDVVDNRRVLGLVVELLGEDIQLMSAQYIVRFPGPGHELWHADGPIVTNLGPGYPPAIPPEALMQLKAAYALVDLDDAGSGVTRVVPGSHRLPIEARRTLDKIDGDPPGAVSLRMDKGDAILFHQSLWHSGGNVTRAQPRYMLFYAYNHVWAHPFDRGEGDEALPDQLNPVQRRLLRPFPGEGPGARFYGPVPCSLRSLLASDDDSPPLDPP